MQIGLRVVACLLLAGCGAAFGADSPGELKRLTRSGTYDVNAGDLIVIAVPSNPSTGPANPAANLKVDVKGKALAAKAYIVFAPPARPIPGAPGEVQAYIAVEGEGEATVAVTLINGKGDEGDTLNFKIKASK